MEVSIIKNIIGEKLGMERNLRNEYRHNSQFRRYVDKYCENHGITVDEAVNHELIKQAYLYYTEV